VNYGRPFYLRSTRGVSLQGVDEHPLSCDSGHPLLAYKHEIRDANGKLFRFQSHQFRHTVGTRMINLGVPHHFIQRYLGHLGPEMTSRYAHIHDATMKEKLAEYLQGTLVDVTGKTLHESDRSTLAISSGSRETFSLRRSQTPTVRYPSSQAHVLIRMPV